MIWLLRLHQQLPAGVNPHPTLKGKKRYEMLEAFNWLLAGYILLHQLLVPISVNLLQTPAGLGTQSYGYWYLYHLAAGFLMLRKFRTARHAYWLVYLGWFGIGYLPLTLAESFVDQGAVRVGWKAISGTLCYATSLALTIALLYRMRMPTTAFLFGLESRIVPKWRYAVPYAALGLTLSLFWIFCPLGKQMSAPPEPVKPPPILNPYD
jgi:hypothetical protein